MLKLSAKPGVVCGARALRSTGPLGSRNRSLIRTAGSVRQDLSPCAVVDLATDQRYLARGIGGHYVELRIEPNGFLVLASPSHSA